MGAFDITNEEKYRCPCCGCYTYKEEPNGNYDICPVCFWEDDPMAYDDPEQDSSCNHVSLTQAKHNDLDFAACHPDMIQYVRKPDASELGDSKE